MVWGHLTSSSGTDNLIAALGRRDRVCLVILWDILSWQLEKIIAAMLVPFPELTDLHLDSRGEELSAIPDSFLGGSALGLRDFWLTGIPFPGLPKLLLSATHLVRLWLANIPHSGYISPEAIVALISVLPSLHTLILEFQSPQSRPDWQGRSLPPRKRSILPALYKFYFKGVTEYLEELVTRVDTPLLDHMNITLFNQIDFDCPRLAQFINRTPTLRALLDARVQFDDSTAAVKLRSRTSEFLTDNLYIAVSCKEADWQLSSIEQLCNFPLHHFSTVENLYIEHGYSQLVWKDDAIENTLWLEVLLPFTAVKNLYLSKEFAPGIAATLEELVGGRITEVLPGLQNIFVEGLEPSGPFQKTIERFVIARQLSGHPVAISDWDKYPYETDPDSDTESV
jgi:hypothetical protein